MSKISGIDLGNPNEPFKIQGTQFGGRDEPITVSRPTADINRHMVDNLVKNLNSNIEEIWKLIEALEVMQEMMTLDEDTDSIILDKKFVSEYSQNVKNLKIKFTDFVRMASSK
jgi:hypothetical protein